MSRVCKKCGGTVKAEDSFCMHCGMPLEKEEPFKEETIKENENKTDVLSVWDYLLMLIILAIPVVNIIVCIFWIIGKNGSPNRRNLAKAWMILAVAGTLLSGALTFAHPDTEAFPCLALARECAKRGGNACAVMNGANEAAVALYLEDKIGFYDISKITEKVMSKDWSKLPVTYEEVLLFDSMARDFAKEQIC